MFFGVLVPKGPRTGTSPQGWKPHRYCTRRKVMFDSTLTRRFKRGYLKSHHGLEDINTRKVYPVELNAYLCQNARILSNHLKSLGLNDLAGQYKQIAMEFQRTLADLMFDDTNSIWNDWDGDTGRARKGEFYPSNLAPLWAGCVSLKDARFDATTLIHYLRKNGVFSHPGGVPTSHIHTGQQWDYR